MDENQSHSSNEKPVLSRRDFMLAGTAATAAGTGLFALYQSKIAPEESSSAPAAIQEEKHVFTTCALCTSGCGLDVRVVDGRAVKVEGNALHPLNQGVCCLRGHSSLEMLYSPERLEHPRIQRGKRGSGNWEEIPWDEALSIISDRLASLRARRLAHTLALVHGELRGQMRSMVNHFMDAFGSPNVISRDSLTVQAVRYANFLTQGINGLPVYDLNNASYVMTFGGNLLETSRNVIANLGAVAFMRRGRPQRGKLVAVHPRLSLTGMKADEWIPIRPGTYGALALGMANVMINSELYDSDFVRDYTFGFEDFTDSQGRQRKGFKSLVTEQYTLERVASITGIASEVIARVAGEFATNRPAVAVLPTEPGELNSGNALFTAMAVHALNAMVASIDEKGGVLVQRFPTMSNWPAISSDTAGIEGLTKPRVDGAGTGDLALAPNAYQNIPDAILSGKPYPLDTLILLHANPVYDLPNLGRTSEALIQTPFVVSITHTLDESASLADLVLPASTFMETWGDDYLEGTGYAGVSLRRPVVQTVHDSRDPGDILLGIAGRLGEPVASALPFTDYLAAVRYRISSSPLDWDKLETNGFWAEMVYFNAPPGSAAWQDVVGRDRISAPKDGRFDFFPRELFALLDWTPEQDSDYLPHFELPLALDDSGSSAAEFPLLLISQQVITQSPTYQGILPTLQETLGLQGRVQWESWVEINEATAEGLHLHDDERVWVESPYGREQALVRVSPGIWPNVVFMPMGMGRHTLVKWGRGSKNAMIVGSNPARIEIPCSGNPGEPISGQAITGPVRVKIYKS